jgi:hypothetical protein
VVAAIAAVRAGAVVEKKKPAYVPGARRRVGTGRWEPVSTPPGRSIHDSERMLWDQVLRQLSGAAGDVELMRMETAEHMLKRAEETLASDQARVSFDDGMQAEFADRIAELRELMVESVVKDGISRTEDPFAALEEKLAGNPFEGELDEMEAHRVWADLNGLAQRVHRYVDNLPAEHAQVKPVLARLKGLEDRIQAGSDSWTRRKEIASVRARWTYDMQGCAGWEQEVAEEHVLGTIRPWLTNKTGMAIRSACQWLENPEIKTLVARYGDVAAVKEVVAEAEQTLAAAGAKLHAAFEKAFAEAEAGPVPEKQYDLSQPTMMAQDAAQWFAGTPYAEPNRARAEALNAKWQAEVARIAAEMAALYAEMEKKADAAWPGIVASIQWKEGFTAEQLAGMKGATVRFQGVRNRTGWDFDASYDFVMWLNGVPVAGPYEPQVRQAMNDTSRMLRQSIDDHMDWDVIAVVEGTGRVRHRVFTDVIDQRTRDVILKMESYESVDCVRIRIIALKAGPVAVGPA